MAVVLKGMTAGERVALTGAMMRSGEVLDWSEAGLPGPALDKHSTGGVGDKVSLLLAPIVAACGGAVPMISGRGLGHTGGTLDKLESIPGYVATPDLDRFRAAVASAGCAIVGQTAALAPADRRLYAIRDATGTVESLPLIVASILSKKLAAGLDALVMDVKAGSGAFMPDLDSARELARAIVDVASGNGLPASALITDMDRVLGRTAGNALEVRESIDHLTGAASDPRLVEVTRRAEPRAAQARRDRRRPGEGAAAAAPRPSASRRWSPRSAARPTSSRTPTRTSAAAQRVVAATPERGGVVQAIDVRAVGLAVVALGGGRRHEAEDVDHAVGLSEVAAPGERVGARRPPAGDRPRAHRRARPRRRSPRCAPRSPSATRPPAETPAIRERLA